MAYESYKYDPYVRAWNRLADGGEICSGGFDPKNDPDDRRKLVVCTLTVILFIVLFVLFSGCTRRVYVPIERSTTEIVTVRDTVVEVQVKEVHDTVAIRTDGKDTTSYLKNGLCYSYATINDGVLGHSLGTFPDAKVKDLIQIREVHTIDSIPYPVTVEVEKKLTFWQQLKIEYGGFAFGLSLAMAFVCFCLFRTFNQTK